MVLYTFLIVGCANRVYESGHLIIEPDFVNKEILKDTHAGEHIAARQLSPNIFVYNNLIIIIFIF